MNTFKQPPIHFICHKLCCLKPTPWFNSSSENIWFQLKILVLYRLIMASYMLLTLEPSDWLFHIILFFALHHLVLSSAPFILSNSQASKRFHYVTNTSTTTCMAPIHHHHHHHQLGMLLLPLPELKELGRMMNLAFSGDTCWKEFSTTTKIIVLLLPDCNFLRKSTRIHYQL